MKNIDTFKILDICWNPSDHKPVTLDIRLRPPNQSRIISASEDILTCYATKTPRRNQKIDNSYVNWETYKAITTVDASTIKYNIEGILQNPNASNMDLLVSRLSSSLYNAAITSQVKLSRSTMDNSMNENNQILNTMDLQNTVLHTELNFWSHVLSSNDSKSLWERINWNGTVTRQHQGNKPNVDELKKHFEEKGKTNNQSTLLCEITRENYVPVLDDEFLEEVQIAVRQLKADKSSGDGWTKRMLTEISTVLFPIILTLYNIILSFHLFPSLWRTSVVTALFKNKGSETNAKMYRPITLVDILPKVFDFMLLNRFVKWFQPDDAQTAYQKGKSCTDHVFLIRHIIYNIKKRRKKLFVITIDFDGAFDQVSRSVLIKKLVLFGAGSTFIKCLASIYMSTYNIIFSGKSFRKYKLYSGIKQGLPLSPMLFSFYINNIFDFFNAIHNGSELTEIINVLIHADDVTILSSSREKAIAKLRSLYTYCNINKIIIVVILLLLLLLLVVVVVVVLLLLVM